MKKNKKNKISAIYSSLIKHKLSLLIVLGTLIIISVLIDILIGPAHLSILEIIKTIFSPQSVEEKSRIIVWIYRLPIALMAVLIGASLGIAGSQMQTILNNPLASPYTLGVSAAAGFGASIALVFGVRIFPTGFNIFLVPLSAFVFSLLSSFLLYLIGIKKRGSTETLILAGVALVFLFNSLISLIQYFSSEDELQAIVFWLFGSLVRTTWPKLLIVLAALIIITPLLTRQAWKLTAMRLGDDKAKSLGVNVAKLRMHTLIYISVLASLAVSFVGTIGFIGLVAPHIARILVGEDQRFFLPFSAFCGALIMSIASILSKSIFPGVIFPIGIITSFIGVPFFLILILKKKQTYW